MTNKRFCFYGNMGVTTYQSVLIVSNNERVYLDRASLLKWPQGKKDKHLNFLYGFAGSNPREDIPLFTSSISR